MVAPHDPPLIADAKRILRTRMRALRRDIPANDPRVAALSACLFDAIMATRPTGPIAATWPLPGEPDLRDLLHRLVAEGHTICLPQTASSGTPLTFHLWTPGCTMESGPYGTQHPNGPEILPGLVLVPLLAFDRTGGRLGYGGGYYDRTLEKLGPVATLGFGFAAQEVTSVPMGLYDRPLDGIVTERGLIRIGA